MAVIITSGCFDLHHQGHVNFLTGAKFLGLCDRRHWHCVEPNKLIVAVNSDESAKLLKQAKWGGKYPVLPHIERMEKVKNFADIVVGFDTEEQLHSLIEQYMPCIIVKGPDYAGKSVTGDDIAPVLILDTPEPESVKEMKRRVYGV